MRTLTEYNERQTRQWAVLVTITLHLALGILLYLGTTAEKSTPSTQKPVETAKSLTKHP